MRSPAEGWGKMLQQLPDQGQGQTAPAPFAVLASRRRKSIVPSDREFQGVLAQKVPCGRCHLRSGVSLRKSESCPQRRLFRRGPQFLRVPKANPFCFPPHPVPAPGPLLTALKACPTSSPPHPHTTTVINTQGKQTRKGCIERVGDSEGPGLHGDPTTGHPL